MQHSFLISHQSISKDKTESSLYHESSLLVLPSTNRKPFCAHDWLHTDDITIIGITALPHNLTLGLHITIFFVD